MSNRLLHETSPYLLQHAENPVEWYPWCKEAFERARSEDKPVFLSIGYSTCHWCHVMAHESFEDEDIARLLNQHFISIKVDKEERPDIDGIYMAVCQAFTGSGGWPTSVFMTAEQKPFFAGTYFPKRGRGGMIGMEELLTLISDKWRTGREALLEQADAIVASLHRPRGAGPGADAAMADAAVKLYERAFDSENGGFGRAPKFPSPHNLMFLLSYYQRYNSASCLEMAERTLTQMYRGGLFDHIGFGFCRYSTDGRFLVPHFEKMLYDNALLILAYCKAHLCSPSGERAGLYLRVAEKTADYILREMTSPQGGFYSAQDADSDGEEGKYYLFAPNETEAVLGQEDGAAFNRRFDIGEGGNFEGKSIPNLLAGDPFDQTMEAFLPRLREYRKGRHSLHLDDKVLTSWNSLMIAAMCELYRASGRERYLRAAKRADGFIRGNLSQGDTLFVSFAAGKRGVKGFLDDYAAYIFAQTALYGATLEREYLDRAAGLCRKVEADFADGRAGGFYFYGKEGEELILRPKETYDGAVPSGNSLMAYNLVRLWHITGEDGCRAGAERQLDFLSGDAARYPMGHAMFLLALLEFHEPLEKVRVVLAGESDREGLPLRLPREAAVAVQGPTAEFPLKDGKTTYYICRGHSCLPPSNSIGEC